MKSILQTVFSAFNEIDEAEYQADCEWYDQSNAEIRASIIEEIERGKHIPDARAAATDA